MKAVICYYDFMDRERFSPVGDSESDDRPISRRMAAARELELPDRSRWGEIQSERIERERRERANLLGLSNDATWGEIFTALDEQERQNVAIELSLHPSTPWRQITAELLRLPGTASDEEMIQKIRELGVMRADKERYQPD